MNAAVFLISAALVAHPLANEDILEPSVQNEVDHAIACAPTNAPAATGPFYQIVTNPCPCGCTACVGPVTTNAVTDIFGTNGLNNTQIAIKLVSSQKSGRWTFGTNDVTAVAIRILQSL